MRVLALQNITCRVNGVLEISDSKVFIEIAWFMVYGYNQLISVFSWILVSGRPPMVPETLHFENPESRKKSQYSCNTCWYYYGNIGECFQQYL